MNELVGYEPTSLKMAPGLIDVANNGIDATDILHVLEFGQVIRSDMLDQRGLWAAVGETVDDVLLEVEIAVSSEECEIELINVTVI